MLTPHKPGVIRLSSPASIWAEAEMITFVLSTFENQGLFKREY